MSQYPTLFSPAHLGTLELPNRVVMAPMATGYADEEHRVTDRLIAYHVARARGGVGLNIVEHTAVDKLGLTGPRMLGIMDKSFVPGLERLTQAVHQAGGRIALQLQHGGRQADPESIGQQCLSASAVVAGRDKRIPQEMTIKQIRQTVRAFADGALRAKQAGFDGVEVHMAHGYLGCSFLSPLLNQRTDAYGGDIEGCTRFARELIEAIHKACGADFPAWCRVSADEFIQGGQTIERMRQIAPLLQQYGYCAIHVSACIGETAYYASAPHVVPEGHLLDLAEAVSRAVSVPVIGVGNIRHPEYAEEVLDAGKCELVALGRQLLADPDWCNKAAGDEDVEITPCILCNLGCLDRRHSPEKLCECVTNPATGHEVEWADWPDGPPAAVSKRVLVIGGGPAGMTAAAVAARRGHDVTLWEAGPSLGGRLATVACADRSHVFEELLDVMAGQLDSAGVHIVWHQVGDVESIVQLGPDVVIIATGSRPADPADVLAEGCEGDHIGASKYIRNPDSKLFSPAIVLGGNEIGCLAALQLAQAGYDVTIVERQEQLGADMAFAARHFVCEELQRRGVRIVTGCEVKKVSHNVVTGLIRGEERHQFPPSAIVVALGHESVNELAQVEHELDVPVHLIGDAKHVCTLHDAIWEGAELGRQI